MAHNAFGPPNTPPGGAPNIAYGGGWWALGPDEALVISHHRPDADYWGWTVHHRHRMDSGDFADHLTSTNGAQAHVDADGRVRLVLAATDPGHPQLDRHRGPARGPARLPLCRDPEPTGARGRGRARGRRAGPPASPAIPGQSRRTPRPAGPPPLAGPLPVTRTCVDHTTSWCTRRTSGWGGRVTWAPPDRPVWVERLNAHGDAVGGAEPPRRARPRGADRHRHGVHRAGRLRGADLAAPLRRAPRRAGGGERPAPGRAPHGPDRGPALAAQPARADRPLVPSNPRSSTSRWPRPGVRHRHGPLGHLDPARDPGLRPVPPGARHLGAAPPGPRSGGGRGVGRRHPCLLARRAARVRGHAPQRR